MIKTTPNPAHDLPIYAVKCQRLTNNGKTSIKSFKITLLADSRKLSALTSLDMIKPIDL